MVLKKGGMLGDFRMVNDTAPGLKTNRGSATENVLYFKCHRKYYNGSALETRRGRPG